jgi:hypothetical protein
MNRLFKTGRRFRVLFPLIMTGLQLGLLGASLMVRREPWVLPTPPASHAQNQSGCPGENCVSFSPAAEPRAGRIIEIAILLNLPAIFLAGILDLVAGVLHFPTGEPSLLGFALVFVPLVWYRIGKWLDDQFWPENLYQSARVTLKSVRRDLIRVIMWFLFVMTLLAFFFEHHRYAGSTSFMIMSFILWTGAYLAGGLWGDRKRSAHRRVDGS